MPMPTTTPVTISPVFQPRSSVDSAGRPPSIDLGANASLESHRIFYRAASSEHTAPKKATNACDAQMEARKVMKNAFFSFFR